jgi:peptidoglycan/LPS O-acetylase OafA/YrhL
MPHDPGCQQRVQRTMRPAVARTFVVAIALTLLFPTVTVYGDDEDHASPGDWIYLAIVSVGAAVLVVTLIAGSRRRVNPHTGLGGRIKRRPVRGSLKRSAGPRRPTSGR